MTSAQQRTKRDYDRQVQGTSTFQSGNWVFIDQRPFSTTSDIDATQTTVSADNKLTTQSLRTSLVIAASPRSLVMDKCGIENAVLIDRAAQAPPLKLLGTTSSHRLHHQDGRDSKAQQQAAQCQFNVAQAESTRHSSVTPQ